MNLDQTTDLVRLIRSLCPAQAIDEHTAEAWQPVLADVTPIDATRAIYAIARNHDARPLFIDPRQILNQIRKTKADTHERNPPQTPPPTNPQQYLQWARSGGREIARNNDAIPAVESDILSPEKSHKYREEIRSIISQLPRL